MSNAHLPPTSALQAVESAADNGSFAAAANKLCITPAAVSQQIRSLEQRLGVDLFERSKSGVTLTRAGENYLLYVRKALSQLRQGQQQLNRFKTQHVLTITTFPSVASRWLMPRVLDWMEQHPEMEIRVEASHESIDFDRSASDICISFGPRPEPGVVGTPLFTDQLVPVASPELLNRLFEGDIDLPLGSPEIRKLLVSAAMIHVDWGDENVHLPGWEQWLREAGLESGLLKGGPRMNLSSMAITAVIQGRGVLLGQRGLIDDELESGRLLALSATELPLGKPYYLVYPQRISQTNEVADFIGWLQASVSG